MPPRRVSVVDTVIADRPDVYTSIKAVPVLATQYKTLSPHALLVHDVLPPRYEYGFGEQQKSSTCHEVLRILRRNKRTSFH